MAGNFRKDGSPAEASEAKANVVKLQAFAGGGFGLAASAETAIPNRTSTKKVPQPFRIVR